MTKSIAEKHYYGDKGLRMIPLYREHVTDKIDALLRRLDPDSGHQKRHEKARTGEIVEFSSLRKAS